MSIVHGYWKFKQVARLSQRDRAAGWASYDQKWKTGMGDNIYGLYGSIHSITVAYLAGKAIEFGEKRKIRAIMPFKVIEVGISRKPVCDFLLVINSN